MRNKVLPLVILLGSMSFAARQLSAQGCLVGCCQSMVFISWQCGNITSTCEAQICEGGEYASLASSCEENFCACATGGLVPWYYLNGSTCPEPPGEASLDKRVFVPRYFYVKSCNGRYVLTSLSQTS